MALGGDQMKISRATLQRYPVYLKALRKLKEEGIKRIMSSELSRLVNIQSTTIRRDFSLVGHLGKQGVGYDVDELIDILEDELGINIDEKIILVGVGNLGHALLKYNNWDNVIGKIVCGFDKYPERVKDVDIPIFDIKDLPSKIPKDCRIAILCVSSEVQNTVNLLADNGIVSIVDLTHEHFNAPKGVHVRCVDIVSTIMELVFETSEFNKE